MTAEHQRSIDTTDLETNGIFLYNPAYHQLCLQRTEDDGVVVELVSVEHTQLILQVPFDPILSFVAARSFRRGAIESNFPITSVHTLRSGTTVNGLNRIGIRLNTPQLVRELIADLLLSEARAIQRGETDSVFPDIAKRVAEQYRRSQRSLSSFARRIAKKQMNK